MNILLAFVDVFFSEKVVWKHYTLYNVYTYIHYINIHYTHIHYTHIHYTKQVFRYNI